VRRTKAIDRAGHDRWLVSYADLVTLLLAFFTTLYAASSIDATKMAPISNSIQQAFAADTGVAKTRAAEQPTAIPAVMPMPRRSNLDDLRLTLEKQLADQVQAHDADVTLDPRGLVVSLPDDAAFAVGSNEVSSAALGTIGTLVETVRSIPNPIRIEGHTDDVPIRTSKYNSNWELSTARAAAVVAYLVEKAGIQPSRLSAAGYGEFHPRVANDSPANRARNRRIDIIILETTK
jgi:chemotaxis protein MotB